MEQLQTIEDRARSFLVTMLTPTGGRLSVGAHVLDEGAAEIARAVRRAAARVHRPVPQCPTCSRVLGQCASRSWCAKEQQWYCLDHCPMG